MRAVLVALGAATLLAGSVSAAPARDALIRPGKGIGRIDLGLTPDQVRARIGRPDQGYGESRSLGRRYVEWFWDRGPQDFFSVGFLGRPGKLVVVEISTTRPRERLSGIGPTSTVRALTRRIRGLRCDLVFPRGGGTITQREYVLGSRSAPHTVFVPGKWRFYRSNPSARIAYVMVRAPEAVEPAQRQRCP